jgi:hypothetical protein
LRCWEVGKPGGWEVEKVGGWEGKRVKKIAKGIAQRAKRNALAISMEFDHE